MNLFSNTSGYDSFMRHIIEIHYAALEKYILSVNKKRELEVKEKLLLRTYCIGTLGVAGEWVSGRYTVTKEEIVNVWEAALPKELEKYFVESWIDAISSLERLSFKKNITIFVGENGSGKSTLLEAIAVSCGFNPEGGIRNW